MLADKLLFYAVKILKSDNSFYATRFIYADKRDIAQNPVVEFTFCCGVGNIQLQQNPDEDIIESRKTKLSLCLLAPSGAGGRELSDKALAACEALRANDTEKVFSEITLSEPAFNSSVASFYCEITITAIEKEPAEEKYTVEINGKPIFEVVTFEASHTEEVEKEPVLLNGYTTISTKAIYNITLETKGAMKIPSEKFELVVADSCIKSVYGGCMAELVGKKLGADGTLINKYKISATAYECEDAEVKNG